MTLTTLVIGGRAAARETAIAAAVDPAVVTALILEGIATGSSQLETLAALDTVRIVRIAPGCMCCVGNLTLRVTLNRILRHPPQQLFISLATSTHLTQILTFLTGAPYDALLTLTDTINCDETA
jgi:hypothetical protein